MSAPVPQLLPDAPRIVIPALPGNAAAAHGTIPAWKLAGCGLAAVAAGYVLYTYAAFAGVDNTNETSSGNSASTARSRATAGKGGGEEEAPRLAPRPGSTMDPAVRDTDGDTNETDGSTERVHRESAYGDGSMVPEGVRLRRVSDAPTDTHPASGNGTTGTVPDLSPPEAAAVAAAGGGTAAAPTPKAPVGDPPTARQLFLAWRRGSGIIHARIAQVFAHNGCAAGWDAAIAMVTGLTAQVAAQRIVSLLTKKDGGGGATLEDYTEDLLLVQVSVCAYMLSPAFSPHTASPLLV